MEWEELISIKNLYTAWCDFSHGKRDKRDVQIFEASLEDELWNLHSDLKQGVYAHRGYTEFRIHDPKERVIHKATVRDRIVHRLVYNELLPMFHKRWLDCSFSCRPAFGQHRSVRYVRQMIVQASRNYRAPCTVVKLDIQKFFEHIDHEVLLKLLSRRVSDLCMRELLSKIVTSHSDSSITGLPIGNLTSQIFANVYLHELDWFVKHSLRQKFYARYADDFLCLVFSDTEAQKYITDVSKFLTERLRLTVHPRKIIVRTVEQGIDWLGIVLLDGYSVLRPATRARMFRRVTSLMHVVGNETARVQSVFGSYSGLLQGVACWRSDRALRQTIALTDACALK